MLTTEFELVSILLAGPFGITRDVQTEAENVVARIEDEGGMTSVDVAALSSHYGETADTVEAVLPDLLSVVEVVGDAHAIDRIERKVAEAIRRNPAARTAVNIALHDLAARHLGVPLYCLWGFDPSRTSASLYTVGLNDLSTVCEKTAEAYETGYDVLKVKLGIDHDRAIIEAARDEAPGVTIRVDANETWTSREAVEMTEFLADHSVEFVERPVPAEDHGGLKFVYGRGTLPIATDESCITAADIPRIADCVDIASLKLMKCGSFAEARRAIHAARAHRLEVVLGCIIGSSATIAASCHLAPLLDYADLDGSFLLAGDPCEGVPMSNGEIDLDALDRPGADARRR